MKLGTVGRSVRIGVIGLGCRGIPQLDVLLSMPDVEVAAVCDVYEDRVAEGQAHVEKSRGVRPFGTTDYREVNAREDIEAVVNMTSWTTHILIARSWAWRAGAGPPWRNAGRSCARARRPACRSCCWKTAAITTPKWRCST